MIPINFSSLPYDCYRVIFSYLNYDSKRVAGSICKIWFKLVWEQEMALADQASGCLLECLAPARLDLTLHGSPQKFLSMLAGKKGAFWDRLTTRWIPKGSFYPSLSIRRYLRTKEEAEKCAGGWHALHVAAMRGFLDVVNILLEEGVSVDVRSDDLTTPLLVACKHRCVPIVERLLEANANPNLTPKDTAFSPVFIAVLSKNIEIIGALAQRSLDPIVLNECKKICIKLGMTEILSLLNTDHKLSKKA